jgi:hypothetical protein
MKAWRAATAQAVPPELLADVFGRKVAADPFDWVRIYLLNSYSWFGERLGQSEVRDCLSCCLASTNWHLTALWKDLQPGTQSARSITLALR